MPQEAEEFSLPTSLDIVQHAACGEHGHPLSTAMQTDWATQLDLIDVFAASRDTLTELQQSAPSRRCHDWLQGIIDTRCMVAAVTGVPF
ncbi:MULTISPECIES: hypothetical protein [Cupriavidus]|uniref:Uncharacterized protein n=1 Tax=Cupriavidus oxalaticus TaxID=96344 RepID=A0A4P7LIW3_9BURK|nr:MULTISPECIES: hypothetical protein [Cupriavidus]QBY56090.1 hypothetical protein E0W60_34125 [Cupriavidus oxalaticus]BDB30456.1 hypothetical protein CTP10_R78730 [Cupriavidus sp. P-10]GLC94819.1 hypothetical protein Tamer19_42270 [Cupriavidus sp. TA19]SPA23674.1 hypothetical protein CBM2633_U10018 [Cupriavidus taiwanensis]